MNYVMISYSDDGGETWSAELWYPLLQPSKNYLYRVVLHRQGSAYKRIYRLRYTEPNNFTLVEANATVSVGI